MGRWGEYARLRRETSFLQTGTRAASRQTAGYVPGGGGGGV